MPSELSPPLISCCLLINLQFYLDDLEDELTITALRMLVKDLLILFQAGNEGVINVLGALPIVISCIPSNSSFFT